MSLIDDFKTGCTLLEKTRTPDGEGGWISEWKDGVKFQAAIVNDSSTAARIAQAEGFTSTYTVTTSLNAHLEFHDVFRRDADGQIFRVTSDGDDKRTPPSASFQFEQVQAERWELPR